MSDEEEITRITSGDIRELMTRKDHQRAYLTVLAGSSVGEMVQVDGDLILGRSLNADVQLLDEGISREHCRIIRAPSGDCILEDLGSTNGVFVNNDPIQAQKLEDGDKIQVGSTTVLKFSYHDNVQEKFQRQMSDNVLKDALTKVFNKRYFTERLGIEFEHAQTVGAPLTLCMMDLDHFKQVNDTYGHLAGDYVLQTMARQIQRELGDGDVFGRYGGEEFALLSRGMDLESARAQAEKLRGVVADHPFVWEAQRMPITLSLGVAGLPDAAITTPNALIAAADEALYVAKNGGRNQVRVYGQ